MRRTIVVLVVGLAIAFGGTARATDDLSSMTNRDRQTQGRQPLVSVAELGSFAQRRAEEMARARKLWHTENLGGHISNWRRLGENVGKGPGLADIQRSFMASADHRDNILLREFSEFGVGVATDGAQTIYVAVIFRQPDDAPATQTAAPPAPRAPRSAAPTTTVTAPPVTTTSTVAPPAHEVIAPAPLPAPEPVPVAEAAPAPAPDAEPARRIARPLTEQPWFIAANSWDPGVPGPDRPASEPMRPTMAGAVVGLLSLCGGVHHALRRRLPRRP